MNTVFRKIIAIFISIFVLSGFALADDRFLIVLPGEEFTAGSPKSGTPDDQTSGVPFVVTVYSVDDTDWTLRNTNASVDMSASETASFSSDTISLDLSEGGVLTCKQYVTVTAGTTATGIMEIYADEASSLGILPGSASLDVQYINSFEFDTITSVTAGEAIQVTITARDDVNNTVTSFDGTADLSAQYTSGPVFELGTVDFTNGVYTGEAVLYRADPGDVVLSAESAAPAVSASSSVFSVSPNTFSQTLIIGPGQEYEPGTLTGNGRSGGSSAASTQTAGSAFDVDVYACDDYFNTVNENSDITLSSSDSNDSYDSAEKTFSGGTVSFSVTLRTVGTGTQTLTAASAAGGITDGTDTVPVTHDTTVDFFGFTDDIADQQSAVPFMAGVVAFDAYNNTVTSYGGSPSVDVIVGTSSMDPDNWYAPAFSFSDGIATVGINIYQKAFNTKLRLEDGAASGDSSDFTVNPGSFSKLLLIAPGEAHDPGDRYNFGKSGAPSVAAAGSAITVEVIAADQYGNRITSVDDTVAVNSDDADASIGGASLPQYVTLTAGSISFNIILETAGDIQITGDDTETAVTAGSVTIPVLSSALSHFEITDIPSNVVAGVTTTATVAAKDEFGNTIENYSGIVYLSSPYTDYSLPYESTMAVANSNAGAFGHQWAVTFTAADSGQRNLNVAFYRAVTWSGSAVLFASDVFDETPEEADGNTGTSQAFDITNDSAVKLQALAPGMEARPGTADGEQGSPLGQAQGQDFTVTVNYVDTWWNIVDDLQEVSMTTSDPENSLVNGQDPSVDPPEEFTENGSVDFVISYSNQSSTFYAEASHATNPSITEDRTPNIPVFQIRNFKITKTDGSALTDQTAGVPFTVSITAYTEELTEPENIAEQFDGTVELRASNNYSDSEYTIEPTVSDNFTNGICEMQVTMYRASTTNTGSGETVDVTFGSVSRSSSQINIWWGAPDRILIIADGMEHKPGLKHVGIPGYEGYSGSPRVVEAGQNFDFDVYTVDTYYNIVRTEPLTSITLSTTDPEAYVNKVTLTAAVSSDNGAFETNEMVLTTVGSGMQTITADHPDSGITNNTSPPISVRHTALSKFTVEGPPDVIAGGPFNITIVARDKYDNICGSANGGEPYNSTAELEASVAGSNTMYPTQYKLSNGMGVASVQLFRALTNERIKANDGSVTTADADTPVIDVEANVFEKLYIQASGMTYAPGRYESQPPAVFPMFTGTPGPQTAGSTVNYSVYSCDSYGNRTITADTAGRTINVTTGDEYAPDIGPVFISEGTNNASFSAEYHTAADNTTLNAQMDIQGISDFTTPEFTVNPAPFYGVQLLVPGLYTENGSGEINSGIWSNGVAGDEYNQLVGSYFPITLQAADQYGNPVTGVNHQIRITSSDDDVDASPGSGAQGIIIDLVNGVTTTPGVLHTVGNRNLFTENLTDSDYNRPLDVNPSINVVTSGNLEYQVIVNGQENVYGVESVTATAYPDTFDFLINVVDQGSTVKMPVGGSNESFNAAAVSAGSANSNEVLNGVLYPTSGIANDGVFHIDAYYTIAEPFRIRVSDPNGVLPTKWSAVIDMAANTFNVGLEVSANPPDTNDYSDIIAQLTDMNGNPVSGRTIMFEVSNDDDVYARFDAGAATTTAVTGSDGRAAARLYTANRLEDVYVEASYNTQTVQTAVRFALTSPVAGEISNYPNPFRAGNESTNIEYILQESTDVKINIYTLMGDLVLSREIRAGEPGAVSGRMNVFEWDGRNAKGDAVGNGGYLCVVEAVVGGERRKMMHKIAVRK